MSRQKWRFPSIVIVRGAMTCSTEGMKQKFNGRRLTPNARFMR
jgi:hypothetical protein